MDNKEFVALVKQMREAQKDYFRSRLDWEHEAHKQYLLRESKSLEKQVDKALAEGIGDDVKAYQTKIEL